MSTQESICHGGCGVVESLKRRENYGTNPMSKLSYARDAVEGADVVREVVKQREVVLDADNVVDPRVLKPQLIVTNLVIAEAPIRS